MTWRCALHAAWRRISFIIQVEARLGAAIFARDSKQLDIFLTNERVLADFQNAKEDLFLFHLRNEEDGKDKKGEGGYVECEWTHWRSQSCLVML